MYSRHINFGVSLPFTFQLHKMTEGIVVVISVVLDGLAAERELLSFDCKVVVLEGRNHPRESLYLEDGKRG